MSSTKPGELENAVRAAVRQKRYDDALTLLQRAVESEPHHAELFESLGTVCTLAGRDAEAAVHFRRACELQPDKAAAYVNLGAVLNRMGQHQPAVEALLKGVQRDANSSPAFYNLGIAYRRLGQRAMATSAYREAIRLSPQFAEAHQNLGNVYLESGNVQQAIAQFKRALEIKPDFDRARRGLETAEEAKRDQAKSTFNPFGRLVGASGTQRVKLDELGGMSQEERAADRGEIRTITQALQTAAKDLRNHFHEAVIPALDEVQGLVAKGRASSLGFIDAKKRFQEAIRRLAKLRRQLKSRVLRLRAHEELLGSHDAG